MRSPFSSQDTNQAAQTVEFHLVIANQFAGFDSPSGSHQRPQARLAGANFWGRPFPAGAADCSTDRIAACWRAGRMGASMFEHITILLSFVYALAVSHLLPARPS